MCPFFSIIIPTYNRLEFLKNAIASVLAQTFTDWEIVIVNDASSDDTASYLKTTTNDKIKFINNEKNLHKGGARNAGIKIAAGKYICFLDDDDYYLENHLEVFYNEIQQSDMQDIVLYTMPISQDYKSKIITKRTLPVMGNKHPIAYLFHHKNGVPTPRMCISKNILNIELFNPNIRIGQDTELLLRIVLKFPVCPINEHTSVMVIHESNSGALKNNTGKERLAGYKYIFSNPYLIKHIPKKLKRYMISYCYLRSADHYSYINDKKQTIRASLKSLFYSPFDKNIKIKLVYIYYNLPFIGNFIKNLMRKTK